jgi:hypothetical protein
MRTRTIVIVSSVLAAVAIGWSLRLHEPAPVEGRSTVTKVSTSRDPVSEPDSPSTQARALSNDQAPIDTAYRARFNEQAREFFAQAPGLPIEEARRRANLLSQELSRIEQAGGLSAGEIFLARAGLIRATEPDEQQQMAQLRALKERYQNNSRQRSDQPDPMFQLYKVREGEIVAEVLALQTIPNGLSRDEYLRQRLQQAREQLLTESM